MAVVLQDTASAEGQRVLALNRAHIPGTHSDSLKVSDSDRSSSRVCVTSTDAHQSKVKVWLGQSSEEPFLLIAGSVEHTTEPPPPTHTHLYLVIQVSPGVWGLLSE